MAESKEGKEVEVVTAEYLDESSDDDGFDYDELPPSSDEDDDAEEAGGADDFASIEKRLNLEASVASHGRPSRDKARTVVRPAVVDDFVRNFFIKMKMTRTLDTFNTEWYELQSKGKLKAEDVTAVPDIYLRNEELDEQIKALRVELDKMKQIAEKAQSTWDKFRKERDFHRMHHKRVVQEKNKLIVDIKRLKKHYAAYEPTLSELRNKYELAMKEKMLMRLERDRLAARAETLELQLKSSEESGTPVEEEKPTRTRRRKKAGGNTPFPEEEVANPYASCKFEPAPAASYQLLKTFKGHVNSVSAIAFHPKKSIVATASDDETWKMWSVPNGELIMSGEGHTSWLSSLDFHPSGKELATASGDGTIKIWDFLTAKCRATLPDHTGACWGVSWHHSGDFLASCSMDHTAKLWDGNSLRCRQTFRGHVDSVNAVTWQPFENSVCTASGDKTVSLWDMRSGLCTQTFYGHRNACSAVSFNLAGSHIASCDADGVVKVWDVRMVAEMATLQDGDHPLNSVSFDRSGTVIAAGSDDGTVKLFKAEGKPETDGPIGALRGHEDAVQCVAFDPQGKMFLSGGSDSTFRIWQA